MPSKTKMKTRGSRNTGKITTTYRDAQGKKVKVKKYYKDGRQTGVKVKSKGRKEKIKF
tara:strand:+ start:4978 stop:5151 length:174 start_codon:yes stop_codon:yes gene_type:complete